MEQLPDDVLAMVMSHLPVQDLLACRLVCKRLAGLAQHPDVWRHRYIDVSNDVGGYGPMSCQQLRLAPCASEILTTIVPTAPACRHGDLRTTSCAASGLTISMLDNQLERLEIVAVIVEIVKQQEALGRLRGVSLLLAHGPRVNLTVVSPDAVTRAVDLLFGTLASTPGLEMVSLGGKLGPRVHIPPGAGLRGTITPSLRTFRCDLVPRPEPFCDYMLAGHAATLEVVHFDPSAPTATFPSSTARLLSGMPNLRKLSCPLIPGLGEVAACESLRELKLTVQRRRVTDDGLGALELLRRAHQIRSLHLCFPDDSVDDEVDDNDFGAELVSELATSGRSQVEMLSIDVDGCSSQILLVPQLGVRLPSLPALRCLVLRVEPDQLLHAISPLTAPSLRNIQILAYDSDYDKCSHEFLHSRRLRALMSRNPLLHVDVAYIISFYPDFDGVEPIEHECKTCKLNCHKELENEEFVGVFAHPKGKCPFPGDHASYCHWIHINDVQHEH